MCESEREGARQGVCVCVREREFVCVSQRERERASVFVCECECECVCERESGYLYHPRENLAESDLRGWHLVEG